MTEGSRGEELFTLRHVSKIFRNGDEKVEIFSDFNLSIRRGQFVALMGPSGSGKSTLLNLLGGLDRVSSGEILYEGRRLDQLRENELAAWRSRNVGFVFQSYNLIPVLTAVQNVELPLLLTKLSGKKRRANAKVALQLVDLENRLNYLPRKLSGGQQQRVAIARAIASDPAVLLCDEPTGNLDRSSADGVLQILKSLNEDHGKTIIMVTHDPAAARFASTTYHLDKGQLATLKSAA